LYREQNCIYQNDNRLIRGHIVSIQSEIPNAPPIWNGELESSYNLTSSTVKFTA